MALVQSGYDCRPTIKGNKHFGWIEFIGRKGKVEEIYINPGELKEEVYKKFCKALEMI